MTNSTIRVMVVDDSALIRRMISDAIENTPGMEVAGTAASGADAISKLPGCNPDVITLDVQMPGMDGIETLGKILEQRPTPVIMVSSLTQRSADTTLAALERGAIDYIAKPQSAKEAVVILQGQLMNKIRSSAGIDVSRVMRIRKKQHTNNASPAPKPQMPAAPTSAYPGYCIAIGISTGGPPALTSLFSRLSSPMPPIVVVQHMPQKFTGPFAARLDSQSALSIKEAATGDILKPDHVYIAPGGNHLHLLKRGTLVKIHIGDGEPVSGHKPSVDVMMTDAAKIFGENCLGVMMTGMGHDGSDGCRLIRENGGYTIGQDEESSDVYGMNKAAMVAGNIDKQFNLAEAPKALVKALDRMKTRVVSNY